MMSASDDIAKSEHRPAGVGPGERLQAARIQQGLSLEDVATRMHLSVGILESIEENSFEEITAPIFVKGYLRAYARIVSLNEDEMIQQYMDFYSEEDPPITSTSNMAPELSVADARIKWTTYLVVLVLAALLAAWWWNKEQSQEVPISLEAPSTATEQESEPKSEVVSSEIKATSETLINSAEPVEQPAEVSDQSEPVAMQKPESATSEVMEPESQVRENTGETGFELIRISPSGSDKLQIVVHADTWADIKDGSDHQLVYDLLRADQTMKLTGAAPFAVFLGNGHGVEIIFNDQEIKVISHIRDDNTARLKIGG